ncbi:hypothetical protein QBC38DRAFT_87508 [Podospora fimiseda]|uniref:Uncharacterized protein n=1 Tax=Podospora fimiseda TaxID=252190 RepID=A0AAN6YPK3_9PEZI|nr:hypothetical protein QBC38DRAFT_87508 [Podospora fimiseda]
MPRSTTRARARDGGAGSSRRARRLRAPPNDLTGEIMWLPSTGELSCLIKDIDEGCYDHPVLVISACPDVKKEVEVLIVTSFHSTSLFQKHRRNPALRKLYLPIHPAPTHPDIKGLLLHLEGNKEMARKSYVNVGQRWRVPFDVLKSYPRRRQAGKYRLTKDSLTIVIGMATESIVSDNGVLEGSSFVGEVGETTSQQSNHSLNVDVSISYQTSTGTPSVNTPAPVSTRLQPPPPRRSNRLSDRVITATSTLPWPRTSSSLASPHTPSLQSDQSFLPSSLHTRIPATYPVQTRPERTPRRPVNGYYYPSPSSPGSPHRGSTWSTFLLLGGCSLVCIGSLFLLFYATQFAWAYSREFIRHVVDFVVSGWVHVKEFLGQVKHNIVKLGIQAWKWFMGMIKSSDGL